jgi:Putative MetA-pathway of phenol degradation
MRWRTRWLSLLAGAALCGLGLPDLSRAQMPSVGMPSMPGMGGGLNMPSALSSPSGLGPMSMPSMGSMPGNEGAQPVGQQASSSDGTISINDSFVSIIDGAAPRNYFILRFDAAYDIRQPTRAEYLFAKGGLPNSPGFPFVETKIDYQELSTHAEYAIAPWLSLFMEVPYRWLNPDVNRNEHGFADVHYGLKLCTWSSDSFIATILLRVNQPTADPSTLGTSHWSVEPGLLAAYRLGSNILIEGELRYWTAIGGSDFAGDLVRYGLGVSYGQRNPGGFWVMPVLEAVGWTIMSGKTIAAASPDNFTIEDARGQTILNGYLGVRLGYGPNLDLYLGYGRAFTSVQWQRDFYRAELRFSF